MTTKAEQWVREGKEPISMLAFEDLPSMLLALKSDRIDGFSTVLVMISYFVGNSNGELTGK